MGQDRIPQHRLQQNKTGNTNTTLPRPLQEQQRKHRNYRCLQNGPWSSTTAETKQRLIEANCIRQLLYERLRKILYRRIRATGSSGLVVGNSNSIHTAN